MADALNENYRWCRFIDITYRISIPFRYFSFSRQTWFLKPQRQLYYLFFERIFVSRTLGVPRSSLSLLILISWLCFRFSWEQLDSSHIQEEDETFSELPVWHFWKICQYNVVRTAAAEQERNRMGRCKRMRTNKKNKSKERRCANQHKKRYHGMNARWYIDKQVFSVGAFYWTRFF